MPHVQPRRVLLVDDSLSDARLTQLWLAQSPRIGDVQVARNGEAALARLMGAEDEPLPDLVLLDVNLPGCSGFEVLEAIGNHERLKDLPVVMLTGSRAPEDAQRALQLNARLCLTKPADADEFAQLVRIVERICEAGSADARSDIP